MAITVREYMKKYLSYNYVVIASKIILIQKYNLNKVKEENG